MSKAYAYVRWSTAKQGEEGRDSHSRQITPLQAFTEAKGVPVVETVSTRESVPSGVQTSA
jgi:DNA invertase Pin-like site-specific DNA recombinase